MKTASTLEIEQHFSIYLEECEESPVVVKDGKLVAVLVAVLEEEDVENLLLAHNP